MTQPEPTLDGPDGFPVKAPRESRAVKDSPLTTYLWERVPRQLLLDARAKCRRTIPRTSLKHRLIALLREWTYSTTDEVNL